MSRKIIFSDRVALRLLMLCFLSPSPTHQVVAFDHRLEEQEYIEARQPRDSRLPRRISRQGLSGRARGTGEPAAEGQVGGGGQERRAARHETAADKRGRGRSRGHEGTAWRGPRHSAFRLRVISTFQQCRCDERWALIETLYFS